MKMATVYDVIVNGKLEEVLNTGYQNNLEFISYMQNAVLPKMQKKYGMSVVLKRRHTRTLEDIRKWERIMAMVAERGYGYDVEL